jgi:hypothetical protein
LVCDVDAASIPRVDVGNLNFEVAYGCFSATSILLSKPACFFRMLDETLWIEMSLFTAMWAFALICKSCLQLIALFLFVFSIAVWTLVRALATSPISLLVCQQHFLLVPRSHARERGRPARCCTLSNKLHSSLKLGFVFRSSSEIIFLYAKF